MNKRKALVSLSDKSGAVDFARFLHEIGMDILSTGGTAKLLREANVPVAEIADYTGFPEMLDGRVKTLHPKVHAGILARRDMPQHVKAMAGADIAFIDLVVVNLYPFARTVAKAECRLDEAIENIDIGGPPYVGAGGKKLEELGVRYGPHRPSAVNPGMKTP